MFLYIILIGIIIINVPFFKLANAEGIALETQVDAFVRFAIVGLLSMNVASAPEKGKSLFLLFCFVLFFVLFVSACFVKVCTLECV